MDFIYQKPKPKVRVWLRDSACQAHSLRGPGIHPQYWMQKERRWVGGRGTSIIPALRKVFFRRQRQENPEIESSLGYTGSRKNLASQAPPAATCS